MKRLLFIGLTLLLAQNLLAQTKVVFSQQGGFYEDSFPLELWCPDGLPLYGEWRYANGRCETLF